ncbi:MAG: preprotein translocase subunit SecG [Lentimonas sp.]|jgi:preprotein translocase subunit SecG
MLPLFPDFQQLRFMGTLFISLLTLILLLLSAFIVLIILMQRTSQSGGMGASLGGGAAESAFGSDTNSILTKGTIYGIFAFFIVSMGLYLMYQARAADSDEAVDFTSLISADEAGAVTPMVESPIAVEGTLESAEATVQAEADLQQAEVSDVEEAVEEVLPPAVK